MPHREISRYLGSAQSLHVIHIQILIFFLCIRYDVAGIVFFYAWAVLCIDRVRKQIFIYARESYFFFPDKVTDGRTAIWIGIRIVRVVLSGLCARKIAARACPRQRSDPLAARISARFTVRFTSSLSLQKSFISVVDARRDGRFDPLHLHRRSMPVLDDARARARASKRARGRERDCVSVCVCVCSLPFSISWRMSSSPADVIGDSPPVAAIDFHMRAQYVLIEMQYKLYPHNIFEFSPPPSLSLVPIKIHFPRQLISRDLVGN